MTTRDIKHRIHTALETLNAEEVSTENDYKVKWGNGSDTFNLLPNLIGIRNKRVELETALKIIEEYE
jgi:hypothetical protein